MRLGELRVLRVRRVIRAAPDHEPAHRFHSCGDEHVALSRLDRVRRHPHRLQRARAVPRDRAAGDLAHPGEHGDDPTHVEALLASGEPTAEHEVVDRGAIEIGQLVERRVDDERSHVVGAFVDQRSLERPTDRGAGSGDDDGLGHDGSSGLGRRAAARLREPPDPALSRAGGAPRGTGRRCGRSCGHPGR